MDSFTEIIGMILKIQISLKKIFKHAIKRVMLKEFIDDVAAKRVHGTKANKKPLHAIEYKNYKNIG